MQFTITKMTQALKNALDNYITPSSWLDDTSHPVTDHELLTENMRLAGELNAATERAHQNSDLADMYRNQAVEAWQVVHKDTDQMADLRAAGVDAEKRVLEMRRERDHARGVAEINEDTIKLCESALRLVSNPKTSKTQPRILCTVCGKVLTIAGYRLHGNVMSTHAKTKRRTKYVDYAYCVPCFTKADKATKKGKK